MQNLRCSLHPTQNIVNFCTRQQCLTQLCATCIGHHTDNHALAGTLPHYENIQQTYKKAHEAVDNHRCAIEGEKQKIISWSQAWEKKKETIFNTIKRAKKDVLDLVERTFSELQHSYVQRIHEEQIKVGMKNGDKALRMLEAHTTQSDKLFNLQKDLKTVRGPQAIKALYGDILPRNTELLNRISSDFTILESHDLKIDYVQNSLIPIKQDIMNLFSLKVCYPEKVIVREPLTQFFETSTFTEKPLMKTRSSFFSRPASVGKSLTTDNFYGSRIILEPKVSITDSLSQTLRSSNGFVRCSRRTNVFPQSHIILR